MFIKRFFNADAAEVEAAPQTETLPISPLAALASGGRINFSGETDNVPEYTPKVEQQTGESQANNADTATEVAANAVLEPLETKELSEQAQMMEQPSAEPVRWQELVKKEQPETILKELGFDEKVVGFLNFWKGGGDLKEYLKEASTDYEKLPPEDVMRHQLRVEYPKASEAQLEVLYQDKVLERYKLTDDYSESEQERGRLLLEAEADKYRDHLVERQQKFILPEPPKFEPQAQPDPIVAEQQQMIDDSKRSVIDSSLYRQVISTNKLTIGEGDEAFSFPVDAKAITDNIYDAEQMVQKLFNVSEVGGKLKITADPKKQLLVGAVLEYGEKFLVEMAKHYKSVGGKKAIEPIENPSVTQSVAVKSDAENLSPAALLAKQGKMS